MDNITNDALDNALETTNVVDFNMNFGHFDPEAVQTDETINLVFVVDVSTSIYPAVDELNKGFTEFVERMKNSHLAENIFMSITLFSTRVLTKESIGFQPIKNFNSLDFSPFINGTTALYDATLYALENALEYRKNLENSGVTAKTILFVMTDGEDNESAPSSPGKVTALIKDLLKEERNFGNFDSILFGINKDMESYFTEATKKMNINHCVTLDNTASDIRKMIACVSASVSSMSAGQGVTVAF